MADEVDKPDKPSRDMFELSEEELRGAHQTRRPLRAEAVERSVDRKMFQLRLEEANTLMQLAANKLKQIEDDAYRYLSDEEREEILKDIEVLSHTTAGLTLRCTYCRQESTRPLGSCATCGRDVCNECGQTVEDAVVHRGNCAMFYQQRK